MTAVTPAMKGAKNHLKPERNTLTAMAVSTCTIKNLKAAWHDTKANASNAQYNNCRNKLIEARVEMLNQKITELLADHEDVKENPHPKARELEAVLQKQAVILQEQLAAVFAMTQGHDNHSAAGSPTVAPRIFGMKKRKNHGTSPLELMPSRRLKRKQDIRRAQ